MSDVNEAAPIGAAESSEAPAQSNEATEVNEGQPKVETPATKNLKKFKFKVDGEDVEEEIDLNDEKAITKHLSMSKAAYKRMSEAAKIRQQNEQFIKMLRENPEDVLTHEQFGGQKKFREIAEKFLLKQIEDEMLSPQQKQQRDNEAKLRKYEEDEKTSKAKADAEMAEKLQEHYRQDYTNQIIKGLESQSVPKTARTVKRMAELMQKNLQHGFELPPEQLAQIVREDYINEMKEMFGASEGDVLLKLLGDDVANKIRKSDLARLKSGNSFNSTQPKSVQVASSKEEPRQMSRDEWKAYIDKRSRE